MGQTLSVAQDYFNEKVKSMVVDSPRTYHEENSWYESLAQDEKAKEETEVDGQIIQEKSSRQRVEEAICRLFSCQRDCAREAEACLIKGVKQRDIKILSLGIIGNSSHARLGRC